MEVRQVVLVGGVLASSNVRGGDAAACFDGMNAALAASRQGGSTPRHQGRLLARAPDGKVDHAESLGKHGEVSRAEVGPAPAEVLAVELSVRQRWQAILKVVLGRGTGAPKQIGAIMVGLSFSCPLRCCINIVSRRENFKRSANCPASLSAFPCK